ncbi:hypothetical protein PCASD_04815 [Puccinia coronata f. sp. avenae]|uniref:Uncharacterized protein n=1 Tax=Puccinia coronata f. sp. avenae TaxID=200324 RepID=A0A2N5V723_9BASI|nr:hypothetical protein PCASD_04815 [Puccinia coronata f. sp. avenae]
MHGTDSRVVLATWRVVSYRQPRFGLNLAIHMAAPAFHFASWVYIKQQIRPDHYPQTAVPASSIALRFLALPIPRPVFNSQPAQASHVQPTMKSFGPTATVILAALVSMASAAYFRPQVEIGAAKGTEVSGLEMLHGTSLEPPCSNADCKVDAWCKYCLARAATTIGGAIADGTYPGPNGYPKDVQS